MALPDPPLSTSILAYNPFFPNGVVSDVWGAYFTALSATIVAGPVQSFNGRTGVVVPVSGDYPASLIPFTQSGTGAVASTVDAKLKQIINLVDWGVKADGVTDDTAAVQAAFNAMTATTTGSLNSAVGNYILNIPKGTIILSSTVAGANSLSQFEFVGQGKRASVFKWTGAAGVPVFKFTNCREAVFKDFGIVGSVANPPSYGIQINRQLSGQVGSGAPTACQFHNVWCGGDSASMMTTGIGYTCTAIGDDSNNDLGLFVGCQFDNCISYGISFEHGNSLLHRLIACGFLNCGGAAVNTVHVNGTFDSSFDAYDCVSLGCASTWRLGGSTHSISIFGWKSEGDTNALVMPATAGSTHTLNLTMSGVSWVGGTGSAAFTFDAGVGSTLDIVGGKWTSPTALALSFPTTGSRVKIEGSYFNFASLTYNNEVDMQNNYVSASAPALTNSGSGVLRMVRSDGSSRVDTLPTITSGTSFSASGLSNSLVILNYGSGTTLSSITNGYPGQILTLRSLNANATIAYGTGTDQLRIVGDAGTNFTLMGRQQITLQRQDSANGNTWVEISRSSPNQVYDFTSGALLYSGRIAGSGSLSQWGPLNGTTTSATFGAGAVAQSLGGFMETLSTGVVNIRTGITGILSASFDATGNFNPKFYTSGVVGGSVASASTISPTGPIFHLTGGTTVNTINLPYTGFTGSILVTTDASVAFGTSGNIATGLTTAAGQVVMFTYDGTKWYPLSINIGTTSNSVYIPQGTTAGTIDYTGATDSTTNLQALLDAAPQGTTFLLGIGTPKFNVIIRKNGVIMQGPGQAQFAGGIAQYWQPADVTKPVVQISDDLASYNGSGVINAMLYTPSGTGQKGLVFAGGSAKCLAVNVFSLGFTKSCIEFRHDDAFPCTFNMASNIAASTNVTGAAAFMFYDRHSAFVGTGSLNTTGGGQMVITGVTSGTVCVGAPIAGTGVTGKVFVTGFISGTNGGNGTYSVSSSQTVASTTLTLGGNAWTTANQVSNFSATAANGYQIVNDGAQTNSMSNGYVQNSFSGNGLLFTQALGALYTPRMNFGQVDVDSTTGFGAITVTVDLSSAGGSNFRTAANVSNAAPIMGQINTSGGAFWVAGHTTNSATFGVAATTITLTSVAGLTAGMQIVVAGAGASGRNYTDQIKSISGSVVTLVNANSSTSVNSGADVQFGDFAPMVNTGAVACSWNNGPVNIGTSNKNTFLGDQPGLMWHSNGGASAGPFSGTDYWTYMADKQMRFAGTVPAVTVTAISRVGTTVTVTAANHNMAVGDPFNLTGITDFDGFNSVNGPNATAFQPVVATAAAGSFTYTSPVSGSNTPANQTPTLVPIKVLSFNRGRLEVPAGSSNNNSGIAFQIPAGTYGMAFHHDNTTAAFYRQTPDTTNGYLDDRFGSGITTGKAWRLGNNSVGDRAYLTGNGAFWLLNAAAPGTDASGSFLYAAMADNRMHVKDASGNDGAILTTTDQVGTFTTAAPTGTTSATAVMMGLGGSATLTPKNSTRIAIMASFQATNSLINDGITCDLRFGTGAAPTNGTAVTGTLLGISQTRTALVAGDRAGMVLIGIATGLTLGTAYWFDVSALAITAGTASITGVTLTAHEI